ncbi:hypothetical protein LHK_01686 [Laribacter hongkongensis HLHK9]|uniref:Uncharacterized protein n=1 Tax=Laribacter hongkongensis (strain HLHK9) TaxID=557598 RepID=C1D881_LARHH|nr:hypothetical protein LHK_01686 [Laribacter hongkongensis HLHK9]
MPVCPSFDRILRRFHGVSAENGAECGLFCTAFSDFSAPAYGNHI